MAVPRRLDIRVDFRLKQHAGGGDPEANDRALRDIKRYVRRKLGALDHIVVEDITTKRVDEERRHE